MQPSGGFDNRKFVLRRRDLCLEGQVFGLVDIVKPAIIEVED